MKVKEGKCESQSVIIHLLGDSIILLCLVNSCLHPSPPWSQTTRSSSIQAEILYFTNPKQIRVSPSARWALIWKVFINCGIIWEFFSQHGGRRGGGSSQSQNVLWLVFTSAKNGKKELLDQKLSNNY